MPDKLRKIVIFADEPMEKLLFRQTTPDDAPRIAEIIRHAQARMRARGSDQWQHGYPGPEHIACDTDKGYGYGLFEEGRMIAYGAVSFDGEPAYADIAGAWPDEEPYVVVHRLAVAEEALGRRLASVFLRKVEILACSRGVTRFRIDTNFDNTPMLRTLERLGFDRCGEIRYEADTRQAFWKRF